MKEFIRIQDKNLFLLNIELLGLKEAQLWISDKPDGPTDNNDERVLKERVVAEQKKTNRIFGIEAVNLIESQKHPGWFEVNTLNWPIGIYRFNIHSKPYVQAPQGTPLRPIRDGQYSWPNFSDEDLTGLPDNQKQFLYLEHNQAGFCMRIEINKERDIKPAGDGPIWISKWPEIKKDVEKHYNKKLNLAKQTK